MNRNRYDRSEWAGAFGDLGTLIPFIIGYISILKFDPLGVLFMFGVFLIVSGFIIEGTNLMKTDLIVAFAALFLTFVLLTNKRIPAMFALLIFGVAVAFVKDSGILRELAAIRPDLRLPQFSLGALTWKELVTGTLILAIPQIPLIIYTGSPRGLLLRGSHRSVLAGITAHI